MINTPASITVSLELAKQLKAAGWPQDDAVYWHSEHAKDGFYLKLVQETHPQSVNHCVEYFAAPTAEEILRRLPEEIRVDRPYWLEIRHGWEIEYRGAENCVDNTPLANVLENSLANAAAAMWCYLMENKLLSS